MEHSNGKHKRPYGHHTSDTKHSYIHLASASARLLGPGLYFTVLYLFCDFRPLPPGVLSRIESERLEGAGAEMSRSVVIIVLFYLSREGLIRLLWGEIAYRLNADRGEARQILA